MPGLWATEIRGPTWSGQGHRYLCRALNEGGAAAQASRIMGSTPGATGFDIYWIDPTQLAGDGVTDLALDAHRAVWNTDVWSRLMAAHHASERASPERHSAEL